jgi:rSAM/selenodomain-associated transferase 2
MPISIVIPTLNEARCLADTLHALRQEGPREIIVADGGSTDATRAAAAQADLLLQTQPGRGIQMNAGAARATADTLLFLHADCRLERGALVAVERCLKRPGVVAGCFRMSVRADGLGFRWIDFFATTRVRLAGMIYGDQGLFLRRRTFERLGGFPPYRLLEDVSFSKQLRRLGRLVVAPRRIFVSPRRWQRTGIVRQTLRNWRLLTLAAAGVHPDRLAAHYPEVR